MVSGSNVSMLRLLNTAAYVLTVAVNYLANALPLNGITTGQVSERYPNLFTPAPYTFAIWGLIYLLLGMFILYQWGFLSRDKQSVQKLVAEMGWLFIIASLANIVWIFFWHYEKIFLTLGAILALLISLSCLYLALSARNRPGSGEKWLVQGTFSIYLGWITVATIANITVFLVSIGWGGLGIPPQIWTQAVILLAVAIAAVFLFRYRDILYSLVIFWALIGILVRHITFYEGVYPGVIIVCGLGLLFLMAGIALVLFKRGRAYII